MSAAYDKYEDGRPRAYLHLTEYGPAMTRAQLDIDYEQRSCKTCGQMFHCPCPKTDRSVQADVG